MLTYATTSPMLSTSFSYSHSSSSFSVSILNQTAANPISQTSSTESSESVSRSAVETSTGQSITKVSYRSGSYVDTDSTESSYQSSQTVVSSTLALYSDSTASTFYHQQIIASTSGISSSSSYSDTDGSTSSTSGVTSATSDVTNTIASTAGFSVRVSIGSTYSSVAQPRTVRATTTTTATYQSATSSALLTATATVTTSTRQTITTTLAGRKMISTYTTAVPGETNVAPNALIGIMSEAEPAYYSTVGGITTGTSGNEILLIPKSGTSSTSLTASAFLLSQVANTTESIGLPFTTAAASPIVASATLRGTSTTTASSTSTQGYTFSSSASTSRNEPKYEIPTFTFYGSDSSYTLTIHETYRSATATTTSLASESQIPFTATGTTGTIGKNAIRTATYEFALKDTVSSTTGTLTTTSGGTVSTLAFFEYQTTVTISLEISDSYRSAYTTTTASTTRYSSQWLTSTVGAQWVFFTNTSTSHTDLKRVATTECGLVCYGASGSASTIRYSSHSSTNTAGTTTATQISVTSTSSTSAMSFAGNVTRIASMAFFTNSFSGGAVLPVDPQMAIGFRPATADQHSAVIYGIPAFTVPTLYGVIHDRFTTQTGTDTSQTTTSSSVLSSVSGTTSISFTHISWHQSVSASVFVSKTDVETYYTAHSYSHDWGSISTYSTGTDTSYSVVTQSGSFVVQETVLSVFSGNTVFLTRSRPVIFEVSGTYVTSDQRYTPATLTTTETYTAQIGFTASLSDSTYRMKYASFAPRLTLDSEGSVARSLSSSTAEPWVKGGYGPVTSAVGHSVSFIPVQFTGTMTVPVGAGTVIGGHTGGIAMRETSYPRTGGAGTTTTMTSSFFRNGTNETAVATVQERFTPAPVASVSSALQVVAATQDLSLLVAQEPLECAAISAAGARPGYTTTSAFSAHSQRSAAITTSRYLYQYQDISQET